MTYLTTVRLTAHQFSIISNTSTTAVSVHEIRRQLAEEEHRTVERSGLEGSPVHFIVTALSIEDVQ
jgi:hypothetical protein